MSRIKASGKKQTGRYAVIMAGGSGERFWPRSRKALPKQFLPMAAQSPMIVETVERIKPLFPEENIIIISGLAHKILLENMFPKLAKRGQIILEPQGRDTAACLALGAAFIAAREKDAVMASFPADHIIKDTGKFLDTVNKAAELAGQGSLMTLGIKPAEPATGYGYIETAPAAKKEASFMRVKAFKEKPDAATARRYIESGRYYWNGGIFVWKTSVFLEELRVHLPAHYAAASEFTKSFAQGRSFDEALFLKLPKISVDYGVMEKTAMAGVIEADFGWDDVGTWTALSKYFYPDAEGNKSSGLTVPLKTSGTNIVYNNEHGKLTALLGVSDLIVVNTKDVLLVASKDNAEQIKAMVKHLEEHGLGHFV